MVAKLKSKGMPVASLRAAKLWRRRQTLMRAPTTGSKSCKFAVEKLGRGRRLRSPLEPSNTGSSLEDALNDAIAVNQGAFALFEEARAAGGDDRLAYYLRIYSKSLELRLKAEKMAREAGKLSGDGRKNPPLHERRPETPPQPPSGKWTTVQPTERDAGIQRPSAISERDSPDRPTGAHRPCETCPTSPVA